MFKVKENEADQMHSLAGIQKGANSTASKGADNSEQVTIIDGEIVDPKKTISPPTTEVRAPGEPPAEKEVDGKGGKSDSDEVTQMKLDAIEKSAKQDIDQA